jgi:hypothetical protein
MNTNKGDVFQWNLGPLEGNPPKIWMDKTEVGGRGRTCHHVLRAKADVVIDVLTCGTTEKGAAGRLAEDIAIKIPE